MTEIRGKASSSVAPALGARRRFVAIALMLMVLAGAAGCGGDKRSPVVVRVGEVTIDLATIDHWTRAITLGSAVESVTGRSRATPRQKALEFLISANWAIAAAAEHGLEVSDGAVERALKDRSEAAPNGRPEFEEEITATGQTLSDVKLEVKASLALAALRESLSRHVPLVRQAQIADYYKHHLQGFRIPDQRVVDLIEEIRGYTHAVALGKQLGPGARFAKRAIRELVPRQTPYEDAHRENGRMVQAIFATPPGRVGGPVVYHSRWVLLVVRKLVPGSVKPLTKVNAEIAERLSEERHRRALASFLETYRQEWTAKTRCKGGFIVQKCSEYRGRMMPEGNPLEDE